MSGEERDAKLIEWFKTAHQHNQELYSDERINISTSLINFNNGVTAVIADLWMLLHDGKEIQDVL